MQSLETHWPRESSHRMEPLRLLEWINANEGTGENVFELIRIEAAHIIAAQAYGPTEALVAVLEAQAPQALVIALKDPNLSETPRLLVALTRALRSVVSAAADTVGPFRWHLPRLVPDTVRLEARHVLEDTFAPDALGVILPFLQHPDSEVRRNVALLLARGLKIESHRVRVSDWDDRAAVWWLVAMLNGDARNQSAALYALGELARDNEPVARALALPIPPSIFQSSTIPPSTSVLPSATTHSSSIHLSTSHVGPSPASELGLLDMHATNPARGRPTSAEPGSLLALTARLPSPSSTHHPTSSSSRPTVPPWASSSSIPSRRGREEREAEGVSVVDIVRTFLPSREGDVREAACLCLSTIIRQLPPRQNAYAHAHALVMWLNVTLEEFAPGSDSYVSTTYSNPSAGPNPNPSAPGAGTNALGIAGPNTAAAAGSNITVPSSPSSNTGVEKCRWRANEVGGGEAARRVVGACYILADFVTDRVDLQTTAMHAGTLLRATRALLALPPVPVPAGGKLPSGRWGSSSGPASGPTPGVPAPGSIAAAGAGLGIGTGSRAGTGIGARRTSIGTGPTSRSISPTSTRARRASSIIGSTSIAAAASTSILSPPLTTWNTTPALPTNANPTGPPQRRLSFAELARRASESGPGAGEGSGFVVRPRRASGASVGVGTGGRRMSSTGGNAETGTTGGNVEVGSTSSSRTDVGMAVDLRSAAVVDGGDDVVMVAPASETRDEPRDVVMSSTGTATTNPTSDQAPVLASTAPPSGATRRRRKPPPDPALGPYSYPNKPTIPPTSSPSGVPPPPAPTSPLRASLLVLLAALVMHKEEHRRALIEAEALGQAASGPGRSGKPTSLEDGTGVTGVLGALGSDDAEVRWAGAMVVRAVGRSTSVLRTGLYDSGIGRTIFEMLMRDDPDRRVLVAVLMVCCNILNQYSPMREMFIRDGGMARLAELADAEESAVRVNALWAFRNALFKATSEESRTVLGVLGWTKLQRLLDDSNDEILEQVLGIIRNVSVAEYDAEWIVSNLSAPRIVSAVERTLSPHSHPHSRPTDELDDERSASIAGLFALAHISAVPAVRTYILGRRRVLEFIGTCLGGRDAQIRCAAASCVVRLAGGGPRRMRELRDAGIEARLRTMRGEEDVETRDHVRRALGMFEGREG
ncbi:ARM repeat-containing protein [Ceratobasidium sp. AG-I]|nr:ARM repeat-containing protein [Ceratobasidium sp. AG-I]